MKTGFAYWHPIVYRNLMRILYGKGFCSRYEAVIDILPKDTSVVDLCCGDCYIYRFLVKKNIDYTGIDINSRFIKHALRRGIKAKSIDIKNCEIPRSRYIIMQGSLFYFAPHHRIIIDKMMAAADEAVIISEPITNVAASKNPVLSYLSMLATRVNGEDFINRFAREDLLSLFKEYNVSLVKEIKGGKDLIGLFKK